MSTVKVDIYRDDHKFGYSEIYVDGSDCGKISDYKDEYSATVTDIITRLLTKMQIENVEVRQFDITQKRTHGNKTYP